MKRPAATDAMHLGDQDLHLFNEGTHVRLYNKLGAHLVESKGVQFGVWAPNAERVSVMGDFNGWNVASHPLRSRGASGIWEGFVPGIGKGTVYKYHVASRVNAHRADKADPFAFHSELPPQTGSVVWDLEYTWGDGEWIQERANRNGARAPIAVYEIHLGSWQRDPSGPERILSCREIAPRLTAYVKDLGFTHVEILPIMEHPFYGSWGYQTTGYFAPSRRYGSPQDFMFLVDTLHQAGIGVLLDWVPSHFPSDEHGLAYFDGTHLYEHQDPKQGFHPDWKSLIFNYGRNEVRSFLLSSALFWLDRYHVDGLRVDAVASMLYLDYSRKEGEWIPNRFGGRENLDAIEFLRRLNEETYGHHPDTVMIAEESTAWPMVSRPAHLGGLGFGMKWDMGWMHDALDYFRKDPVHRRYHHDRLTFRMLYAFNENFVLPLSHDEVVHGKGSLLFKMPGDHWQKLSNLRLLFGYLYGQAGKKLIFMGGEFAQWDEWRHDHSLDWHLTQYAPHSGMQRWIRDLNAAYRAHPALHEGDFDPAGFEWVDANDADASAISFLRKKSGAPEVLIVCNFTPVARHGYRVGVPRGGPWREILNSDADVYGGSGIGNGGRVDAQETPAHGRAFSLEILLPPLAILFFAPE